MKLRRFSPSLATKFFGFGLISITHSNFTVLVFETGELGPGQKLGNFSEIMETEKSINVD